MKWFAAYVANLGRSIRAWGLNAGGIRRRRRAVAGAGWMHQSQYALNWTQQACLDADGSIPLRGGLRLAAVKRS